ncbi:hypothetical protein DRQ09_08985 [candidate division KSB1 bacterium]|nr:MAG: hypothetical protein DRQ09_08985 [candidate division KSB1 bacterium]
MPSEKEINEENLKMKRLRFIVDLTMNILYQQNLTMKESLELIIATKKSVLKLFPDKSETFDLIYLPRFYRVVKEKFLTGGNDGY